MVTGRPRLAWRPRGKGRYFCHWPAAAEWLPIDRAIREGYHVMLCWDADRDEWRCDFIQRGRLYSGDGLTIGDAATAAWAALARPEGA